MEQLPNTHLNEESAQNQVLYDKINNDAFINLVNNIRGIYSDSHSPDTDKKRRRDELIKEWNENYFQYLKSEWSRLRMVCEDSLRKGGKDSFPNYQDNTTLLQPFLTKMGFRQPRYTDILDCSVNLADIDLPCAILKNISFKKGNLDNANLYGTNMEHIDFSNANLEKTVMRSSTLIDVNFDSANMKSANLFSVNFDKCILSRAILTGVRFGESEFKNCHCRWALFDGGSIFNDVKVDNKTDFTGSVIRNASMSPRLLTALEDNIREIRWKEWYENRKFADVGPINKFILKIAQVIMVAILTITFMGILSVFMGEYVVFLLNFIGFIFLLFCLIPLSIFYTVCANFSMKCFWALTNYGRSTSGILIVYLVWTLVFTIIYFIFATLSVNEGVMSAPINFLVTLFQTMISGFYPDFLITIAVNPEFQLIWTLVTCTHLMGSYLLLAALVSRFSILLNSLSP